MRNHKARSALKSSLRWAPLLLALAFHGSAHSQTLPQEPIPPAWQALGILVWPASTDKIKLTYDQIVKPGQVQIKARSDLRFTQAMALFVRPSHVQGPLEQLTLVNFGPRELPQFQWKLNIKETLSFVVLAKSATGWVMNEGEIKVGRPE